MILSVIFPGANLGYDEDGDIDAGVNMVDNIILPEINSTGFTGLILSQEAANDEFENNRQEIVILFDSIRCRPVS